MAQAPLTSTKYEDITEDVNFIAYGASKFIPSQMNPGWSNLNGFTLDHLMHFEESYVLADKVIRGKICSVESCVSAPRVMVKVGDKEKYTVLEGTLFGSPKDLGVSLDDVIEIKL